MSTGFESVVEGCCCFCPIKMYTDHNVGIYYPVVNQNCIACWFSTVWYPGYCPFKDITQWRNLVELYHEIITVVAMDSSTTVNHDHL